MRILLVEDTIGEHIIKILARWDYETVLACNAEEAWRILQHQEVDFVLVDWMLPGASGLVLVKNIRQDDKLNALPIVMMSGRSAKQDIVTAIRTGINSYIAKPFTPSQLKEKIDAVIKDQAIPLDLVALKRFCTESVHFDRFAKKPLVVIGEGSKEFEALQQINRRDTAHMLLRLGRVVDDFDFDCLLGDNTYEIAQHINSAIDRSRLKLIIFSTACFGNISLLIHMLNINHPNLPIVMIYNDYDQDLVDHVTSMRGSQIKIVRYQDLDENTLRELLSIHVVKTEKNKIQNVHSTPELIPPDLIGELELGDALISLPTVYYRVIELVKMANYELDEWIKVIKSDALSEATICRYARSAVFDFDAPIDGIEQAVKALGFLEVRQIIISETVQRTCKDINEDEFILADWWRHNIAAGVTADLLAFSIDPTKWDAEQKVFMQRQNINENIGDFFRDLNLPKRLNLDGPLEDPFGGGAMHDLGIVAMIRSFPGLFPMLIKEMESRQWQASMLEVESEMTSGINHLTIAKTMARRWQLDAAISRAVCLHHQPPFDDSYAWLIGVANLIAFTVYPFPAKAKMPLSAAILRGDVSLVRILLAEDLQNTNIMDIDNLVQLSRMLGPAVKHRTEEIANSLAIN